VSTEVSLESGVMPYLFFEKGRAYLFCRWRSGSEGGDRDRLGQVRIGKAKMEIPGKADPPSATL
jgi:hypothetical protein